MKSKARDLEADLAICEAATSGPWEGFNGNFVRAERGDGLYWIVAEIHFVPIRECGPDRLQNLRFIVEAREGWPYAIRRAMQAEAEVDRLRNELNILQEQLE